jgi:hypothetical protein
MLSSYFKSYSLKSSKQALLLTTLSSLLPKCVKFSFMRCLLHGKISSQSLPKLLKIRRYLNFKTTCNASPTRTLLLLLVRLETCNQTITIIKDNNPTVVVLISLIILALHPALYQDMPAILYLSMPSMAI